MQRLFLIGIAALFLATGAAHGETQTDEGLARWCREHPDTVASECVEHGKTRVDSMATSQWIDHCRAALTTTKSTWPQWACIMYVDGIMGTLLVTDKICARKMPRKEMQLNLSLQK